MTRKQQVFFSSDTTNAVLCLIAVPCWHAVFQIVYDSKIRYELDVSYFCFFLFAVYISECMSHILSTKCITRRKLFMQSTIITTITMAIMILIASMTSVWEETTLMDTDITGTREASIEHETFKSYISKHITEISEFQTICELQDHMEHGKNE